MALCTFLLFLWYITPFLLGSPTSTPGLGELSITVLLPHSHMDGLFLQNTVSRPLVSVAGLKGGHMLQAGYFYKCWERNFFGGWNLLNWQDVWAATFPFSRRREPIRQMSSTQREQSSRCREKRPDHILWASGVIWTYAPLLNIISPENINVN